MRLGGQFPCGERVAALRDLKVGREDHYGHRAVRRDEWPAAHSAGDSAVQREHLTLGYLPPSVGWILRNRAGLTLPNSSGKVEGQVNRIKMFKRQMYGRVNPDLLRKRSLLARLRRVGITKCVPEPRLGRR